MHSALTPLIRFIFRGLISLFVIAVILASGSFLLEQGRLLRASNSDLQTLTGANASVAVYRERMTSLLTERMAEARTESLDQIDQRIKQVRVTRDQFVALRDKSLLSFPLAGPDKFAERISARFQNALMAEITGQELAYLQQLKSIFQGELEKRKIAYEAARTVLFQKIKAFNQPGSVRMSTMVDFVATEQVAYQQARSAYEAQAKVRTLANLPAFSRDQQAIDAVTKEMTDRLEQARTAVTTNWFARYVSPVIHVLPLALAVLLSSFAAHFLIKVLFYFVLAPLAARRKPIQLEAPMATHGLHATASAVSQDIRLQHGEELLILPEFLQSSSTAAIKDTKLMLDWSCPWTSIISGMVMLTRVRTSSRHDHVVVSSDSDAVSELALVTIPAGAAMVFQPHGMVGVIYPSATPLKITRRWRLFSAHAWLTLQLRYLIFRGPVTLIVKGTRGVRVEPAGQGRIISQFATLGFSSHLHYATVRSETFWPYYQDKTPLLQDKFDGENGYYLYDETPRFGKRGGFFSRGLEGLTDAVLKVFGI